MRRRDVDVDAILDQVKAVEEFGSPTEVDGRVREGSDGRREVGGRGKGQWCPRSIELDSLTVGERPTFEEVLSERRASRFHRPAAREGLKGWKGGSMSEGRGRWWKG